MAPDDADTEITSARPVRSADTEITSAEPRGLVDSESMSVHPPYPVGADVTPTRPLMEQPPPMEPRPPPRVGRFRILHTLGVGGMGVVYAAHDAELDRPVAVKLLRYDTRAGSQGRARMLREAQAMAKLSHPNVVQVYDVGEYEGQVFVAMEFVLGETLREWANARPRTVPEVLRVYLAAGQGLAAAHDAGLVHRDFKPDNVLLGQDGRVRVADFGLVRTAGSGDPEVAKTGSNKIPVDDSLTQAGAVIGTPAYMAPEQHLGAVADARTDQYSFCVALHEALHGVRPFAGRSRDEIRENLFRRRFAPVPRNTRVPPRIRAALLRGLSHAPERRYPSMTDLLAELGHDPDARSRRWRSAGLGFALLAAASSASFALAQRGVACRDASSRLVGVWDDARRDAVEQSFQATGLGYAADTWPRVRAVLDAHADAWVAAHTETCEAHQRGELGSELLHLQMTCLKRQQEQLRALVDTLSQADATTLANAVDAAWSLPAPTLCGDGDRILAERSRLGSPADPVAQAVEQQQLLLAEAAALRSAGRYEAGLERAEALIATAKTLAYPPLLVEAQVLRGALLFGAGRYAEADTTLNEAMLTGIQLGFDRMVAEAGVERLATLTTGLARYDEAANFYPLVEAMITRVDPNGPVASRFRLCRGNLFLRQGKLADARKDYLQALEMRERLLGADHPEVATALANLGAVSLADGKFVEAEGYFERALTIRERAFGPEHPEVATAMNNLANAIADQGQYAAAQALSERVLGIRERTLGPDHPDVVATLNNLAVVRWNQSDVDGAREYLERALAMQEKNLGPDHDEVASIRSNLAVILGSQGKFDEARAQLQRALAARLHTLGPEHALVADVYNTLGNHEQMLGDYAAARVQHTRALAIREKAAGAEHPSVALSLGNLANALAGEEKFEEAERAYTRALAIYEKVLGPEHVELALWHYNLSETLARLERFDDAWAHLEHALRLATSAGPDNSLLIEIWTGRAEVLLARRDPRAAVRELEQALRLGEAKELRAEALARTRFFLARALWSTPSQRARANALAVLAEEGFRRTPNAYRAELARFEAWRKHHIR